MVTFVNVVTYWNALSPISSMPSGKSIEVNPVCAKAAVPIVFSPSGNVTLVSDLLLLKHWFDKVSIPCGRIMLTNLLCSPPARPMLNALGNVVTTAVPSLFINVACERSRFISTSFIAAMVFRSVSFIWPFIITVPSPISNASLTASSVICPTLEVVMVLVLVNSTSPLWSLQFASSCAVTLAVAPS